MIHTRTFERSHALRVLTTSLQTNNQYIYTYYIGKKLWLTYAYPLWLQWGVPNYVSAELEVLNIWALAAWKSWRLIKRVALIHPPSILSQQGLIMIEQEHLPTNQNIRHILNFFFFISSIKNILKETAPHIGNVRKRH